MTFKKLDRMTLIDIINSHFDSTKYSTPFTLLNDLKNNFDTLTDKSVYMNCIDDMMKKIQLIKDKKHIDCIAVKVREK